MTGCCKYCGQTIGPELRTTAPELMHRIIRVVAQELNVTTQTIIAIAPRFRNLTDARQLVMYLTREIIGLPWHTIGLHLGPRHHSTIIHGHDKILKRMATKPEFAALVYRLEERITTPQLESPQDDTLPWIHFPSDEA